VGETDLQIDGVSKRYGDVVALSEMTFDVRAGELFGFVGGNGAGKTTTMRIVLGVLSADAGEVRWRGRPLTLVTRRRIGYMPEERGLYPKMKVGEQLRYFARLHGLSGPSAQRSVDEWLERLGVAARADDELERLSLGNQQRVQLACALVHRPELLVLDEPFSGLDPVAVDVMSQVLRDAAGAGIPVVFSSHQLDLVERLCDRVGIVRSGRMVAAGSVDELRAGAPTDLIVEAPQAPNGWADGLDGVAAARREGDRTILELRPDADDQKILAAALATGPVREFARRRPSLSDIFRAVVMDRTNGPAGTGRRGPASAEPLPPPRPATAIPVTTPAGPAPPAGAVNPGPAPGPAAGPAEGSGGADSDTTDRAPARPENPNSPEMAK
jgi:ABC-2 type transport system ATP-binding protein